MRVFAQDNWQLYMYAAVDATGHDTGPYVDSHLEVAVFFVAFMIIGSFFFVQLFVGVFIDTYQNVLVEMKAKSVRRLELNSSNNGLARQDSISSDTSTGTSGSAFAMAEPASKTRLVFSDVMHHKE